MSDEKLNLRKVYAAARRERADDGAALQRQLARIEGEVGAYFPQPNEPNVLPYLEALPRVLVPRLYGDSGQRLPAGQWGWHRQGESWQHVKEFAPAQPWRSDGTAAQVDVLLVPALAVSREGVRLGKGGGWYDRALIGVTAFKVAVCFPDEVVPHLPEEPHDQRVDAIVTGAGWTFINSR